MTKLATIRAQMDPQLKAEAEDILQELGLSAAQALTLFYQQIRLNRGLPFTLPRRDSSAVRPTPPSTDEVGAFPVDANRTLMQHNVEAYQSMHSELVKQYEGQFVAICDAQLVDHDADPVALLQRVRATYPGQVVLRRKVEHVAERELHIRHPRFERV